MDKVKMILVYTWCIMALFGGIAAFMPPREAFLLSAFVLSGSVLAVLVDIRGKESTAGIERLIWLGKWLEKGLSYRLVRIIVGLSLIPVILLQKLGCRAFGIRYESRFGNVAVKPVNGITQQYHAAAMIFPYAIVATLAILALLIERS